MKHGFHAILLLVFARLLTAQQLTLTPAAINTSDAELPGPYAMGTISVTPTSNVQVTLTTNSDVAPWLWFSSDGTCNSATITRSLPVSLGSAGPVDIQVCLVNMPTGGTFVALVTAAAANYTTVSAGVFVSSFPGGNVIVDPSTADVSLAPKTVLFQDFTDGSGLPANNQPGLTAAQIAYAPGLPAGWLVETESANANTSTDCQGFLNCTVTLSADASTAGLIPKTVYTAAISFQDVTNGNIASVVVTFTAPTPLKITSAASFSSLVNQPFSFTLTAIGGSGTYTWSATGLPAGATLSPAGVLSGTVASNGSSHVVVSVQDSSGNSVSQNVTLSFTQPLLFVPVTPCRVVDTRRPTDTLGGPDIAGGTSRDFALQTGNCGVPAGAQAYSLNVTVAPKAALGYLTVWPTGQTRPTASTLNSDGRVKANAAIVPAGVNGSISVYASNESQVILDVNGYFTTAAANPSALAFYPVTPCRIADTRHANGVFGGPIISGGVSRDFPISQSDCNVPANAAAYSLNFTLVPPEPVGYLTTWPAGDPQPTVSTLNDAGKPVVTANAAIVPAGTGGGISVFVSNDSHVVIDVNGYFAPPGPGGLSFYTLPPCRVLDTRFAPGQGAFENSLDIDFQTSPCAVPNANAYAVNATVVPAGPLAFLTLWPQGQTQPTVSTLNAIDGAVTANMALVPSNTSNASITAFASNPTQLVIDIFGFFAQ